MDEPGPKFKVVDDRYRDEPDDMQELADQLLQGLTVFLPDATNSSITTMYARFASRYNRGLRRRARTVDGVSGYVVWLDPASPENLEG